MSREATVKLIREALRWCDFAAGEGHCRKQSDGSYWGPEDFLADYSTVTGDEDWEGIPDRVSAMMDEALASPSSTTGGTDGG